MAVLRDDLAAWRSRCAARTARDPRHWAPALIGLGGGLVLAGVLLTPPWINAGLAVAGLGAVLGLSPLLRTPAFAFGAAYSLWVVVSMLAAWSDGIPGSRPLPPGSAFVWLATPLVGLGLAGFRARRRTATVVLAIAVAAVAVALVQFTVGVGEGFLRIDPAGERLRVARGFSEHHLTFGLACALLVVCTAQPRTLWAAGAGCAWAARVVAALGLAVCGSRAAMLGAVVGLWASFSVRGRRWAVAGLVLALVLGGALAARQYATDPRRFAKMVNLQDGRWPIWRASIALAGERPMLGLGGKDAFKLAYPAAFQRANPGAVSEFPNGAPHAHNAALSLATEYGLPALVLQFGFWLVVLLWLWRHRIEAPDAWRLGLGVASVAFIGGQFEPYPTRVMQGAAIHAFLGLAIALALAPPAATKPESTLP